MTKRGHGKRVITFRVPKPLADRLDKAAEDLGFPNTSTLISLILTKKAEDPGVYVAIYNGDDKVVRAARIAGQIKMLIRELRAKEINNTPSVWCWLALASWDADKIRLQ